MRTKLTPKEVRAIAIDGGEGWLVLADLAHEYGNEDLAESAARAAGGEAHFSSIPIENISVEGAILVATRAARRSIEREMAHGRRPSSDSLRAIEAVENGLRGDEIKRIRSFSRSSANAAMAASQDSQSNNPASVSAKLSRTYAAHAAALVADAAYYACPGSYAEPAKAAHAAANSARFSAHSIDYAASKNEEHAYAASLSAFSEELTLQLVDIFEVWWESVCARS